MPKNQFLTINNFTQILLHLLLFLLILPVNILSDSISKLKTFELDFYITPRTFLIEKENETSIYFSKFISEMQSPICLTSNINCFNISLSFSTYYSWINVNADDKKLFYKYSPTFHKQDDSVYFTVSENIISGLKCDDILLTNSNEKFTFNFISVLDYTTDKGVITNGEIGLNLEDFYHGFLGIEFYNESIFEQLTSKDRINSKLITIEFDQNNERTGKIILGDSYEKFINKKKKLELTFNPKDMLKSFSPVDINLVVRQKHYFDHGYSNLQTFSMFRVVHSDYTSNYMVIPVQFFIRIKDFIFGDLIKEGLCYYKQNVTIQNGDNFYYIVCDEQVLQNQKLKNMEIQFTISFSFGFNLLDLFYPFEEFELGEFIFGIVGKEQNECFSLGYHILNKFILRLDTENSLMTFYEPENSKKKSSINYIFIAILALVIITYGLTFICSIGKLCGKKDKENKKLRHTFLAIKKSERNKNAENTDTDYEL